MFGYKFSYILRRLKAIVAFAATFLFAGCSSVIITHRYYQVYGLDETTTSDNRIPKDEAVRNRPDYQLSIGACPPTGSDMIDVYLRVKSRTWNGFMSSLHHCIVNIGGIARDEELIWTTDYRDQPDQENLVARRPLDGNVWVEHYAVLHLKEKFDETAQFRIILPPIGGDAKSGLSLAFTRTVVRFRDFNQSPQ